MNKTILYILVYTIVIIVAINWYIDGGKYEPLIIILTSSIMIINYLYELKINKTWLYNYLFKEYSYINNNYQPPGLTISAEDIVNEFKKFDFYRSKIFSIKPFIMSTFILFLLSFSIFKINNFEYLSVIVTQKEKVSIRNINIDNNLTKLNPKKTIYNIPMFTFVLTTWIFIYIIIITIITDALNRNLKRKLEGLSKRNDLKELADKVKFLLKDYELKHPNSKEVLINIFKFYPITANDFK